MPAVPHLWKVGFEEGRGRPREERIRDQIRNLPGPDPFIDDRTEGVEEPTRDPRRHGA